MRDVLRRIGALVAIAAVALALTGVGVVWAVGRYLTLPLDTEDDYVLLVLGSDEGPPRSGSVLTGRADGFHVLVVSKNQRDVSILSFPRDTWVNVPGLGRERINASLTRGPETAVATAEAVTGLQVDDWIVTGFDAFILGVGEIGGVQIDVETRLSHLGVIEPGPQRLGGTGALNYVRDRKSRPHGDLDRAESHARFLQALHAQLAGEQPDLRRLVSLVSTLDRHTESSLSTDKMLRLAALAMRIQPENVRRARLDARLGSVGSASVVFLTSAAEATIADVRDDGVLGVPSLPDVPDAPEAPATPDPPEAPDPTSP